MSGKTDNKWCSWRLGVNIGVYLLLLFVTVLGASLEFNGMSASKIVSMYNPVFWTAEYANVIFGVLALIGLLGFVVYRLLSKDHDKVGRRVEIPFWFLSGFGVIWTFAFYYDVQWLALVSMIAYTITAVLIYTELGIGKERVDRSTYWCIYFPFALIAAGALFHMLGQLNIFCAAYGLTWWGMTEFEWALVGMLVLTVIGSYVMVRRPSFVFGSAMVWWSASVAVYQMEMMDNALISIAAVAMALYFAYITFSATIHKSRQLKK